MIRIYKEPYYHTNYTSYQWYFFLDNTALGFNTKRTHGRLYKDTKEEAILSALFKQLH